MSSASASARNVLLCNSLVSLARSGGPQMFCPGAAPSAERFRANQQKLLQLIQGETLVNAQSTSDSSVLLRNKLSLLMRSGTSDVPIHGRTMCWIHSADGANGAVVQLRCRSLECVGHLSSRRRAPQHPDVPRALGRGGCTAALALHRMRSDFEQASV